MGTEQQGKYRVGVIGCGRAGTSRARAFDVHPLCRVVAIADTDPENLDLASRRFGVPGYADYQEMLRREAIDIAVPVLPVRANAGAVVAAAEAGGKAIFCEKPLTAQLSEADRMVESCRSRGVHLASGVMVSSHPDYRRAYQLARDGAIGQVQRINLYEANSQGGCHGLNLARKFADRAPVEWVVGQVGGDPMSDFEEAYEEGDTGFGELGGIIRFANGIECYSSFAANAWRGIEVVGSQGLICNWNNTALGLRLFKSGQRGGPLVEEEGVFSAYDEAERGYDEQGWQDPGVSMREIVEDIVRVLQEGGQLAVTSGDDLRHALEMAIALRQSHRRGGARVALPLADRSLEMYPEKSRWNYKKDLMGAEAYMAQMARQVQEGN
ncbi:MAG: hypothetical protein GKR89_17605 [Candidatus Latescibacteria bacterium]|nr:hypothetical protein [Candidatus Latescibacterota bacterium]